MLCYPGSILEKKNIIGNDDKLYFPLKITDITDDSEALDFSLKTQEYIFKP